MQPETAQPVAMIRFDVADQMMLYSLDFLYTFSSRKKFIGLLAPIASPDLSSGSRGRVVWLVVF